MEGVIYKRLITVIFFGLFSLLACGRGGGGFEAEGTVGRTVAPSDLKEENSIGSARMEQDGTIVLRLRAESSDEAIGDALLRFPPGHPKYEQLLKHLGGLEKGQNKSVPPWPEK